MENKEKKPFVTEKIKGFKFDRKQIIKIVCFTIGLAVLFGVIATLTSTVFKPFITNKLMAKESKIEINVPEESSEAGESDGPKAASLSAAGDYEVFKDAMYTKAREISKAMVSVSANEDAAWLETEEYESTLTSGVIIAKTNYSFVILTELNSEWDPDNVQVSFYNSSKKYSGSVYNYDSNTGLAIVQVPISSVDEGIQQSTTAVTLGNSYNINQGSSLVALGSLFGRNYAISIGSAWAVKNTVSVSDANYTVINSDIIGSAKTNGVLLNTNGDVVGIISSRFMSEEDNYVITALSIRDIKGLLEDLVNNVNLPYIGLKTTTISSEISTQYGIPVGTFVTDIDMDSPGMEGGIQKGDVVTRLNGKSILTSAGYAAELRNLRPGDKATMTVMRPSQSGYREISCDIEIASVRDR